MFESKIFAIIKIKKNISKLITNILVGKQSTERRSKYLPISFEKIGLLDMIPFHIIYTTVWFK